ncbi:MAG: C25 family cysteine peptidase [Phycisphaerae bacterium]|nr:C25 family cysteine peptidase [Phycisphaerae bacterium]
MAVTTAVIALLTSVPPAEHLVVAPARFRAALAPFLEHRRSASPHLHGSAFAPLELVLAVSEGRDDAEKLKHYLYARWKSCGTRSCLLVGDCDVMPMRSMALDRATEPAFNWAFYPCDLYYSDVARADGSFDDWNAAADDFHAGYFGEVHGESIKDGPINFDAIDYRPDVAVGRWPVSTPEQAAAVAAKTIAFEAELDAKPRAGFFAVGGWVDVRERVRVFAARLAVNYDVEVFLHDASDSTAPDEAHMRTALATHPRWIFHTGHGSPGAYEGCLAMNTLTGVQQTDALPICVSAGCSTSEVMTQAPYQPYVDVAGIQHIGTNAGERFTSPPPPPNVYQTGASNSTSLAEELVRREHGGAVATIGCVTGSQPCAVSLIDGLTEAIASGTPTLGACWNHAVARYWEIERLDAINPTADWYPASIFFQGMKFIVLGDPGLRVR